MEEIQRFNREPSPFYNIILSLLNPFVFEAETTYMERLVALKTAYLADDTDLWRYRTYMVSFFNALISYSDIADDRMRVRTLLESCGLRKIIKVFPFFNNSFWGRVSRLIRLRFNRTLILLSVTRI